jgi:hypothetical protein
MVMRALPGTVSPCDRSQVASVHDDVARLQIQLTLCEVQRQQSKMKFVIALKRNEWGEMKNFQTNQ